MPSSGGTGTCCRPSGAGWARPGRRRGRSGPSARCASGPWPAPARSKALARGPVPEEALAGLTQGQREAVRLILESRDRVVGVQGYAGTGKTTMLRRAASLMGERRVLGLAPSASAARTLSRETGLACRTLQWFLTRCGEVADGVADAQTLGRLRQRYRGAVVVVDEMSLAGTAQARALLRIADRLEVARLVLVGDSRQLRGVQAGQPFRQMQEAGMAVAEMDELRRQRDPDLKAAVQNMIEGEPGEALERLGSNLQELPAEEIARIAAALWLRLSPGARGRDGAAGADARAQGRGRGSGARGAGGRGRAPRRLHGDRDARAAQPDAGRDGRPAQLARGRHRALQPRDEALPHSARTTPAR